MAEPYFYDATTKVGDEEGINKFVLKSMVDEVAHSTYHNYSRHIRGTSKKPILSSNYVVT